jgi:hypothetical protein
MFKDLIEVAESYTTGKLYDKAIEAYKAAIENTNEDVLKNYAERKLQNVVRESIKDAK